MALMNNSLSVCFLTTSFKDEGGGDCYYQLAKELVKNGIRVKAVIPDDVETQSKEIMDAIEVHRFQYWWPKRFQKVAHGKGIPENLRTSFWAKLQLPFFLLSFCLKSLRVAKNCDIIHGFWTSSGIPAVLIKKINKKPFILTVAGSDLRLIPKWINKYVLNKADLIISATPELNSILRKIYGKEKNVIDIKHMIDFETDISTEDIKKELGLGNETVITFVGRLYEFKDPMTFIKAIPLVKKSVSNIKFLMVGYGSLAEQIKQAVNKLGIENDIILTGKRTDVNKILRCSDIFTALSPIENCFSATILEAMITGIPCILTDAGYTSKCFVHREYAYIIPPKNERGLTKAILELLEDTNLRKKLAANGKQFLTKMGFSKSIIIQKTIEAYENLIS